MRILIVGGGGREHALAWKLSQEAEVFAAPGNPGISRVAECLPIRADNFDAISVACREKEVGLVVIGPEIPLIEGLADRLRSEGSLVFGPGAEAAQLEGSKSFSKAMMSKAGVPTAAYRSFTDANEAIAFALDLHERGCGIVVKASGPALGKGAIVTSSLEEAMDAINRCLVAREFGDASSCIVLEERMHGSEFSLFTICSESGFCSLPAAQDYKRAFDEDEGPNTGGMGSYSPVDWVTSELVHEAEKQVVAPILKQVADEGIVFRGLLYSGLMRVDGKLKCIEYNVRFGDPETQSVVCRLGCGLADALLAAANGEPVPPVEALDNAAVSVVIASAGYPGSVETGHLITQEPVEEGIHIFHAGTKLVDGELLTAGGRVAAITATDANLTLARDKAYRNINGIRFEGARWRTDIGAPTKTF